MKTRSEGEVKELMNQFDDGYYEGYQRAIKDFEKAMTKLDLDYDGIYSHINYSKKITQEELINRDLN